MVPTIFFLGGAFFLFIEKSYAADVTLAWDAVSTPNLGGYQVFYSQNSNKYSDSIDAGNKTSIRIQGLQDGTKYFFSVKAYSADRTTAGNYSNEISTLITAPITANFSENDTSGYAPLLVNFTDTSAGNITKRNWDFGDGTTSIAPTAIKAYSKPGIYTVTLMVSGPNGTETKTKTNLITVMDPGLSSVATANTSGSGSVSTQPLGASTEQAADFFEAGSLDITDKWQYVSFNRTFNDPVVVTGSLSDNSKEPTVVRIRNVTPAGFEVRIQEWEYLDGKHTVETLNYLVMERGRHTLEDGSQVEAGSVLTDRTGQYESIDFAETFPIKPVVFTAVTSLNGSDAVTTRVQNIYPDGFQVGMQKQEGSSDPWQHAAETVSYIAWEPSASDMPTRDFEAHFSAEDVDHLPYRIEYQNSFVNPPIILVAMQTTADEDPANLRWSANDAFGVDVRVSEEQSKDDDLVHAREIVGYLAISR